MGNPLLAGFVGYDSQGNPINSTPAQQSTGTPQFGPVPSGISPVETGGGMMSGWASDPWHQQTSRELMLNALLSDGYNQYGRGAVIAQDGSHQYNPYWNASQKNLYTAATGNNSLATATPAPAPTNTQAFPDWAAGNPLLADFYGGANMGTTQPQPAVQNTTPTPTTPPQNTATSTTSPTSTGNNMPEWAVGNPLLTDFYKVQSNPYQVYGNQGNSPNLSNLY